MTAICVRLSSNYIPNFLKVQNDSQVVSREMLWLHLKRAGKFFFLQKILKPKQVGYSTTEWNYKACLYTDLISASLLRATDVIR